MSLPITTAQARPILRPDEVQTFLLDRIARESLAGQVATTVFIDSPALTVPDMGDLDVADWIEEGQEIPLGEIQFNETRIVPQSIKGGTVITKELAEDSSPAAADLIGRALADDLRRKVDAAFFGSKGASNAPAGLGDLTGMQTLAGPAFEVGLFLSALMQVEANDGQVGAWVAHPTTAAELADMNLTGQLGQPAHDVSTRVRTGIQGVPVLVTPSLPAGEVWGIDRRSTLLVIRQDAQIEADASVFFTSYRVAIRSRMRVGWAFTRPQSLIKITKSV